jgi:hypothetical protein
MNMDRAVEAAASAWAAHYEDLDPTNPYDLEAIRIAVEAAAPHIVGAEPFWALYQDMKERAERAEAEIDRTKGLKKAARNYAKQAEKLKAEVLKRGEFIQQLQIEVEDALTLVDELAEALRTAQSYLGFDTPLVRDALAKWEASRTPKN